MSSHTRRPVCLYLLLFITTRLTYAITNDALSKHFPGKTIIASGISVLAPDIAENGAVVSIGLGVEHLPPGTHVRKVWFFKAYKPEAPIATFTLSATARANGLTTRVKLSRSTDIIIFAELSNGEILTARKSVRISVGGCGSGGGDYYAGGSPSHTPSVSASPSPAYTSSTISAAKSSTGSQYYGAH